MKYQDFKNKIELHTKSLTVLEILTTIEDGLYRLSTNLTLFPFDKKFESLFETSLNITLGYSLEEVLDGYLLEMLGGKKLDGKIYYSNGEDDFVKIDILWQADDNSIVLVEVKIRDDHDKGKSDDNLIDFSRKVDLVADEYPDKQITAIMYFVDGGIRKHRKKYQDRLDELNSKEENKDSISSYLLYGEEFFMFKPKIWEELNQHLTTFREEFYPTYLTSKNDDASTDLIKDKTTSIINILETLNNEQFKYIQRFILDNNSLRRIRKYYAKDKGKRAKKLVSLIDKKLNDKQLTLPGII